MQETDPVPLGPLASLQAQCQYGERTHSSQHGQIFSPALSRQLAPLNPRCIVCGVQNPNGLHLAFQTGSSSVSAAWVPREGWESFQGTIHGGVITAVLDEAMSKAVIACGWEAFTVDLRVRFRGRVSPGDKLHLRGWIVEKRKRRILTEASLVTNTATERAHAWGVFLVPRSESAA